MTLNTSNISTQKCKDCNNLKNKTSTNKTSTNEKSIKDTKKGLDEKCNKCNNIEYLIEMEKYRFNECHGGC